MDKQSLYTRQNNSTRQSNLSHLCSFTLQAVGAKGRVEHIWGNPLSGHSYIVGGRFLKNVPSINRHSERARRQIYGGLFLDFNQSINCKFNEVKKPNHLDVYGQKLFSVTITPWST